MIYQTVKREYLLTFRARQTWLNALIFFVLIAVLFPFGTSADVNLLPKIGPAVIWMAALLSNFLSLSQLFHTDEREGCVELMLLSPQPLSQIIFGKMLMHWLLYSGPLIIVAPILAILLQLPMHVLGVLWMGLILGTWIFQALGTLLSALTLGLRQSSLLLGLLIFPLYVPVLILGSNSVLLSMQGFSAAGPLLWLAILCVVIAWVTPFLAAGALRMSSTLSSQNFS